MNTSNMQRLHQGQLSSPLTSNVVHYFDVNLRDVPYEISPSPDVEISFSYGGGRTGVK